jgi:tRNA1Val (adenine37-N6)-methyltransferase
MARKPFAFKQFTVAQETVTLAVTTDACLFGASIELGSAATVLDLGTGTGLLLMMLAQRYPQIQGFGLELDSATALQAAANAASSPFHKRLHIAQGDWNDPEWNIVNPPTYPIEGNTSQAQGKFDSLENAAPSHPTPAWPKRFDAIVCNPPFFEGQQESRDELKRSARHQASGSLAKLLNRAAALLNPGGQLHLLLPPESCPLHWGPWYIVSRRPISAHPEKAPHLLHISLGLEPSTCQEMETLFTYEKPGVYSPMAIELLRDFYLNL